MRAGAGAYGEQQPAVALACEPLFDLLRATLTLVLQARSRLLSIAGAVHIISCILHNEHLVDIDFDHQPSSCVRHSAWQREGLAVSPVSALRQGWRGVLIFLRRVFKVRGLARRCASMQQQPHLLCQHAAATTPLVPRIKRLSQFTARPHSLPHAPRSCGRPFSLSCPTSQPLAPSSAAAACMRIICSRPRNSASARRSAGLSSRRCRSGTATTSVCRCCAAAARFLWSLIAWPASLAGRKATGKRFCFTEGHNGSKNATWTVCASSSAA